MINLGLVQLSNGFICMDGTIVKITLPQIKKRSQKLNQKYVLRMLMMGKYGSSLIYNIWTEFTAGVKWIIVHVVTFYCKR